MSVWLITRAALHLPTDVFVGPLLPRIAHNVLMLPRAFANVPVYQPWVWIAALVAMLLGMQTVLWTTWGRDWTEKATPASVVAEVDRRLAPGGCVLLHDSDCTSASGSWRSALGALPLLAERLEERGLKPGPLSDHGISVS